MIIIIVIIIIIIIIIIVKQGIKSDTETLLWKGPFASLGVWGNTSTAVKRLLLLLLLFYLVGFPSPLRRNIGKGILQKYLIWLSLHFLPARTAPTPPPPQKKNCMGSVQASKQTFDKQLELLLNHVKRCYFNFGLSQRVTSKRQEISISIYFSFHLFGSFFLFLFRVP